ncbi:MAG: hypothetical protein KUG52_04435 [Immundisolibacteraceae bacterium]|nr:hypothetical protein [Immundisolibacteraceae bacterium]
MLVKPIRMIAVVALMASGLGLASCSSDPVQAAYDDCMGQMAEAKVEVSNDAMKGMLAGIKEMGESACGMILTSCEKDRESAVCQGMIKKYVEAE